MIWLMGAIAFLGGILNAIEAGSNASLNKALGQPMVVASSSLSPTWPFSL